MAVTGQPDQSGITRLLSTINSLVRPRETRGGREEVGGGREEGGSGVAETVQSNQPMMLFVLSADRRRRAREPPASDGQI